MSEIPTQIDEVAIVALATWTQPDYEKLRKDCPIWAINDAPARYKFECDLIVAMDDFDRDVKTHPKYVDSIVNAGVPVVSTRRFKKWPSVISYPLKKIVKLYEDDFEVCRVLDNTVNYAFLLALSRGAKTIHMFGADWSFQDKWVDLQLAKKYWELTGVDAPDWFKYYGPDVIIKRRHMEPGGDSFHFLLGYAIGKGVKVNLHPRTTLLNTDRDKFFYGYQIQPRVG